MYSRVIYVYGVCNSSDSVLHTNVYTWLHPEHTVKYYPVVGENQLN